MRPGTLLRWHALKGILKSEVKSNAVVLDIGGYDGFTSNNLMRLVPNLDVTVVDIDGAGLQSAKKKGLKTVYASALELPIRSNHADIVLCLDLIEHVNEDSKVIKEISRVLKKNGKLILTTPMENGVSFPFMDREKVEAINRNWGHIRLGYSLEQMEIIFRHGNLTMEKTCAYFNFLTRLVYRFTILVKRNTLKWFFCRVIMKLEPFIDYGAECHIVIGKK